MYKLNYLSNPMEVVLFTVEMMKFTMYRMYALGRPLPKGNGITGGELERFTSNPLKKRLYRVRGAHGANEILTEERPLRLRCWIIVLEPHCMPG